MTTPLVSIVIPCYNAEKDIGEAVQSALDQTYPNVEVIVIDDGCTDGSLEVIRSFGDKIRWETGPNRGGSAARNRGVELARGEYIQFLDADDLLFPQKLSRQMPLVLKKTADLILCDWERRSKEDPNHPVTCSGEFDSEDSVARAVLQEIHTPAPVHHKRLLLSIGGFREELPCLQDRDLYLRLACSGATFGYIPETLYTVRKRLGSVSSNILRMCDQGGPIHRNVYKQLQEAGEMTDQRAEAFATIVARSARNYLQLGERAKAHEYFQIAREMHPGGDLGGAYPSHPRMAAFLLRVLGAARTERVAMLYITFRDSLRRLKRSIWKAIGK